MAGETVDNFLVEKLNRAIDDKETTKHPLSSALFDLHSDFKKLRDLLLARNTTTPAQRRENLYYLNNLLGEWQLLVKSQSIYTPDGLKSAYKLSKMLKKIKKDVGGGEGSGSGSKPEVSETEIIPDTFRWSSRTVDPTKVHGLKYKERFLERLLVRKECKNGFKALAIVGMPGIGKTTLCQLMFNNEKVKNHFQLRIWVCLSKQPADDENEKKEAVKRMLICLGVEDEIIEKAGEDPDLGLQRLIFALRLQLMGNRYLIVLDDAWKYTFKNNLLPDSNQEDEELAYGLPKGDGGTVVITTRSEEIGKKMVGEENLHQLPILEDKESCWNIFKDAVEVEDIKFPKELIPLQDLIVEKCAGLPLAAKMMGEIMRENLRKNPIDKQMQNQELN